MGAPFFGFAPPPTQLLTGLEGIGQVAQGLGQFYQNRLFAQDLQNMTNPGFAPQSQQGQQLMGQNMFQNLGLANQPITPSQREGFDIQREGIQQRRDVAMARPPQSSGFLTATENDGTGLAKGTVYERSPTGNIEILQRPPTNEPWEDRYKFWQDSLRRSRGTDTQTATNRLLAEAMGTTLPPVNDVEGENLATEELKKLRKERNLPDVPDKLLDKVTVKPAIPQQPTLAKSKAPGPLPSQIVGGTKAKGAAFDARVFNEVLPLATRPRWEIYKEAAKLRDIWSELTEEEGVSAYKKIAIDGWSGEEFLAAWKARNAK